jgi:hypothetical protein
VEVSADLGERKRRPLEATVSRTLMTIGIAALALLAFAYPALGQVLR